jgi:riboflavin kinase/FMN adenylyltransferase
MSLFRTNYDSIPPQAQICALTIGNFDGVHLGHRAIVGELCRLAKKRGLKSVVVTFDPPPVQLLRPGSRPAMLTTFEQRGALLQAIGVDVVVILKTSTDLLNMEGKEFFDEVLLQRFEMRAMVEGKNFQFGKNRSGTQERLKQWCEQSNIELIITEDQILDAAPISSSRIRTAIENGDMSDANQMLGRPYTVTGTVVHGLARGRTIGFPTANLGQVETLRPGPGIYAARCVVGETTYPAAVHIGPNISFDEHEHKVECYLVGFSEDLYGQNLEVEFLRKLRDVQKFDSVDALIEQMRMDVQQTADLVNRSGILL